MTRARASELSRGVDYISRRVIKDPRTSFRLGDTRLFFRSARRLSNYWPLTLICRPADQRWSRRSVAEESQGQGGGGDGATRSLTRKWRRPRVCLRRVYTVHARASATAVRVYHSRRRISDIFLGDRLARGGRDGGSGREIPSSIAELPSKRPCESTAVGS